MSGAARDKQYNTLTMNKGLAYSLLTILSCSIRRNRLTFEIMHHSYRSFIGVVVVRSRVAVDFYR